ncbi:PREDICTED: uncharacterized protein LOC109584820 isoform X2 [Amphimedon queenslandica]|uniref:Uncharacterized protein n=1 Tax=Amphimedon queenslandica TaxID=400682 RepID=A0AAN0JGU3_AMPQE|nr:PREDICTED: uncharacterized protein LOC109584820 isoform X2 [Amphimedon queenslandica]|eukprot:XP_019856255.1 PREDICTED: uncharacterized protein LOC109584820 isoform X2 [Amphimedon queenslandica]
MLSRFLLRSRPRFSESFFSKFPHHCLRNSSSTVQATGSQSKIVKKSVSIKHKDEEVMKKLKSLEAERSIKSNVAETVRFSSVEFSGSKEDIQYVTEAMEQFYPGSIIPNSKNQVIDIILNLNDSLKNLLEHKSLSMEDFSNFVKCLSTTGGLEDAKINMIVRERPFLQYGSVKAYSIGPTQNCKTDSSAKIQLHHDATQIINVSITHNLCDGTRVGYKVQQQLMNAFPKYLIVIDSVSIPIPSSGPVYII